MATRRLGLDDINIVEVDTHQRTCSVNTAHDQRSVGAGNEAQGSETLEQMRNEGLAEREGAGSRKQGAGPGVGQEAEGLQGPGQVCGAGSVGGGASRFIVWSCCSSHHEPDADYSYAAVAGGEAPQRPRLLGRVSLVDRTSHSHTLSLTHTHTDVTFLFMLLSLRVKSHAWLPLWQLIAVLFI